MENKVKVFNDRKYDIGVKLLNDQHQNIRAGSFIMMSPDDIAFVESQCAYNKRLFGSGKLRIAEIDNEISDAIGIVPSFENVQPSREDIEKNLRGSAAAIKKWVDGFEDKAVLFEIFEIAKEMDLAASKMKVIKERLPEVLTIED